MIAEAPGHLQLSAFFNQAELDRYKTLFDTITEMQSRCETEITRLNIKLDQFKQQGCEKSSTFRYWNIFVDDVAPGLRDLTRSFCEGDWDRHLSAIQRAIPLCFAFDRVNYKTWLPTYFEECRALPEKVPVIYESFTKGGFAVRHTSQRGSGVPMDQALEKAYNKPAKGHGGMEH